MSRKPIKLIGLASALAALPGVTGLTPALADVNVGTSNITDAAKANLSNTPKPNVFMSTGQDLLGLIVTKTPAGVVVAQHYSHVSHSSHSSHASHYSSS